MAYKSLSEAGSTDAQIFLGWMYLHGLGCDTDPARARHILAGAAGLGSAAGQFWLAKLLASAGELDDAVTWYELAAQKAYSPALYRLGYLHECGRGVAVDIRKALHYYERGSELGHVFARRNLARLLLNGHRGVTGRLVGATLWVSAIATALQIALKDPYDERLVQ